MEKDIYKLAKDFPTLGSIMKNTTLSSGNSITGNCISFRREKFQNFFPSVENICKKVEDYTEIIEKQHWDMLNKSKSSCIYLYYWLYYYNNNKNMGHIKSLFHELLKAIDTSHNNICSEIAYTTITDDEMQKLKDLHDMYTKLNNIENNTTSFDDKCSCANECAISYMKYKNPCESNSFSDFCNELKNVREKYNALSTIKSCNHLTYKILPLFQKNNITFPVVITIILILLISITLFILLKFTPYNSCFQGALSRKRNKWNNIDEDYVIFQSYKNESNASMNNRHHILYHTL
ncbi:variable surface protein [Plasmodium gonderi]|uniref:Variable surface protein n=1 Tax=Plasmodium gonderi TaxID=77519 RepID=A0A1Y1JVA1_PLAGO|nr:variable surface protein [Plasmodium gonderi]GAW84313.1 variable surface protein [Plasmodium gonderi]